MAQERTEQTRVRNAVIYCRVSSTAQVRRGHGLESQEMRCREYAAAQGYQVNAVFPDDVSGGGDFMERPGMVALISFLRAQPDKSYVVIFDDLKRFARDTEFHIKLRRTLNEVGARIECLNFRFEDTPEGEFVETIMAAQGQLERKQNRRQVIQKMRARLEAGYYQFAPVYGYSYAKVPEHGRIIVPQEPAASYVRNAFEGMACGRFRSIAEVKRFLEAESDAPRNEKGEVRTTFVTDLLRRSLYAGLITVPKWNIENHPGKHEALISYETFARVQEVLDGRAHAPARKNLNRDFPLRGFVNCSCCDKPLTGAWSTSRSGKKHPYYLCYTKGCEMRGKSLRRADVEKAFEEVLQELEPRAPLGDVAKAMFRDAWDMRRCSLKAASERLRARVEAINSKIDKLMDRLVDADGDVVIAAYEAKLKKLQHEKLLGKERLAGSGKPLCTFEEAFEHAMRFLTNPSKIWGLGRFDLRQAVLRLAFAEPMTYDKKLGLRTGKTTLPFRCLGEISAMKCGMVGPAGFEPATTPL